MLNEVVARALKDGKIAAREDFHLLPACHDRAAWNAVDPETRAYYAGAAEAYIGKPVPSLPASLYMEFVRVGDRKRYETPYFERHRALFALTVCECIENSGRCLNDIVDLVWAICEESSWVIPAHNNHSVSARHVAPIALPDVEDQPPYIDLFSAETGALLSLVNHLLGEKLGEISPIIPRRMSLEIERRILTPYLERDDPFWMGFASDRPVNNWNPWINSNVLVCALLEEVSPERRDALLARIARSLDRFLDGYAPDGGCDEGPSYFNVAGASMLDALELFDLASGGAASIYDEPLIQNMARYILYAHIHGRYHVNFADAPALVAPDAMLLHRAAERMGLDDLKRYAEYALAAGFAASPYQLIRHTEYRRLRNLLTYRRSSEALPAADEPLSHAFDGIQVACARQHADGTGLYFAAKGGHNSESHNHNDIGNYILYADGEPVLCDVGVETYCRKTFSAERYDIWTMQSRYHNTVILGGSDQRPGQQYAARDFSFTDDGNAAVFHVDMAGAYGEDAHAQRYLREIRLDRATGELTVHDRFALTEAHAPIELPLMLSAEPRLAPGEAYIPYAKNRVVRLSFDPNVFDAACERIPLTDSQLLNNWQRPALFRLVLTRRDLPLTGEHTLRFR